MAIRTQVTALVFLTSASLVACSAADVGDAPAPAPAPALAPAPSGSSETQEAPVAPAPQPKPKHGRLHLPVNAGLMITSPIIAKPLVASMSTANTTYAYGESIPVTFSNMSILAGSWIGIAPQGSASTVYAWYAYTDGATSGTVSPAAGDNLPPGTYVARAYFGDSYTIEGESAAFTVGAVSPAPGTTVTIANGSGGTNTSFGGFETISASFTGLTASTAYDVGVFPTYGSTGLPYAIVSVTANADGAGTAALTDLLSGVDYEVRVFQGSSWKLTGPTKFRVTPAARAKKSSFASADAIEIEFAGMQGLSFVDKVLIAPSGSADTTITQSLNADWYWSGSLTFTRPSAGSYVARIFNGVGDTTTKQAQSLAFEVQ